MPVGSGGGVNSVGLKGRKNREIVTVSPATATPDWSKGQ